MAGEDEENFESSNLMVLYFLCLPDKESTKESAPRAKAPPRAATPPVARGAFP
jgi:hypothetical protein